VEVLSRYRTIIVAELNNGQFAAYLQAHMPQAHIRRVNKIQGQPFLVHEIVESVAQIIDEEKEEKK